MWAHAICSDEYLGSLQIAGRRVEVGVRSQGEVEEMREKEGNVTEDERWEES